MAFIEPAFKFLDDDQTGKLSFKNLYNLDYKLAMRSRGTADEEWAQDITPHPPHLTPLTAIDRADGDRRLRQNRVR